MDDTARPGKTLHITNFYHETSGGIRTFYKKLLDAANRLQRLIRLVVPGSADSVETVGRFAKIYRVASPRAPAFDRRYRLIMPTSYLLPRGAVRRILCKEQPDLVEITDKYTMIYLAGMIRRRYIRGFGRPVVVGMSCERLDDNFAAYLTRSSLGLRFARWYVRNVYIPMFDIHLGVSPYVVGEFHQACPGGMVRPVAIARMGVEIDQFSPSRRNWELRQSLQIRSGGNEETTLLLYAGRLSPEKNLELLVDTMACLSKEPGRDFRLVVIGDGPLRNRLASDASAKASGRILFVDHIATRETLGALYASCDVFVHTNPHEPFGIAPLEAMASGLALVGPRSGGLLAYANDGNSWLASPEGTAFAEAVQRSVRDGADRRRRIERALATAREFAWERVLESHFHLLDRIREGFIPDISCVRLPEASLSVEGVLP